MTRKGTTVFLVLAAVGTASWARLQADRGDWPQWRGSHRDAKADGFTAPKTWPKELTKKWTVAVGGGDATPALVGDKLYAFGRQGGDEVIRCLDAATGKEVWQEKYATEPATGPGGGPHAGPRSSPTVAEGKVVTLGVRGVLSCFDAATGKRLWSKDEYKGWPNFFTSSSPIVVDGLCVAQLGGRNNGVVVAYDLAGGAEKWKHAKANPSYASPVLMTVGGTKLIVAGTDSGIVALTATDGKLAWEALFDPQGTQGISRYRASTPIVDGQTLIYLDGGVVKAVRIEKQGDRFTAKELWSTTTDNPVEHNTPVLKDGLLVGLSTRNQLFAVNAQTGKPAGAAPMPQASGAGGGGGKAGGRGGRGMGGGGGFGSVVDAGSVLLALTPGMQLVVFQPGDKEFKQVASYKVADTPTYAYPVVSGNRVYVKDQESLTLWTIE